jgi:hypothetical protein
MSPSPPQVHDGPMSSHSPRPMHQVHKISITETILEFQENTKTLHLAPCFLEVVHKMEDSLRNKDCFYFVNKHIQWLHYQLFSFGLCVVFIIFIFLISLENWQQCARHSTNFSWIRDRSYWKYNFFIFPTSPRMP